MVPSRGLPAAFSNTGGFLSREDAEEIGQTHAGGRVESVVPLKQQGGEGHASMLLLLINLAHQFQQRLPGVVVGLGALVHKTLHRRKGVFALTLANPWASFRQ